MTEEKDKEKVNEKQKEIVIARIEAQLPSNLKLSIGSGESLTKQEMIKHVEDGDEQGKQIMNMHINFIKAISSGKLAKELSSV